MKMRANRMGMPVIVRIEDKFAEKEDVVEVFKYFQEIDEVFSTYKPESQLMKINRGEINKNSYSDVMKKVLRLSEQTKKQTDGYFNIKNNHLIDPSGLVKGFAIWESVKRLKKKGYKNFILEIAGDIQTQGFNQEGKEWRVGIRNPFNKREIIKVLHLSGRGIATSGTYVRGEHIYNPILHKSANDIASMTVIADNIYEADRFATAAFAMGEQGIQFISRKKGLEGYMITHSQKALYTPGFAKYVV